METAEVARQLIGQTLVSKAGGHTTSGLIVETEAYLPARDSACHASKHRTPRTEVMFGPAGVAYVYPIHARHCFNVVTEAEGPGCAVLIRAVQPIVGRRVMETRRGTDDLRRLTSGPACVCESLGISRAINGWDLTQGDLIWIAGSTSGPLDNFRIKQSRRIGVTSAKSRLLRFYMAGNPYVSGPVNMRT